MRNLAFIILMAGLVLTGCGTAAQAQPALGFAFVTAAPNPSATPTPFQPVPWTPTGTFIPTPTFNPATETPIPALTQTEVPTIDPNMLLNTLEPLSTIDPAGSQVLNNGQETVNFLLIGSDKRPGGSFRTDTMVIAILRPNEGQVSLISIPRDLWVFIPGWENQRINTAYQHGISAGYPGGGPGTAQGNDPVQPRHPHRPHCHGGVRRLPQDRRHPGRRGCPSLLSLHGLATDRLPTWTLRTKTTGTCTPPSPGLIHMDGDLALWYARSRQKSNDFDRGRRQQEVLRSLFNQALQGGTLSRLPQLYND